MMGDSFYNCADRWNIPDDRQLALRGRLETGWSSYSENNFGNHTTYITDEEQELIISVLQKEEMIQLQEQHRIGKLVNKLEYMKKSILGDGVSTCLICGTKAGYLKDQLHFCGNCGKMVCSKCGLEVHTPCDRYGWVCVLCNEDKMLWKRSGAWFYNAIPKYVMPETNNNGSIREKSRQNSYRPFGGSPNSSPLLRKGSSCIDLQDSFDVSDDSDIESTSAKAFEIPEDKLSVYIINTDEDSRSLRSNSPTLSLKRGSVLSRRPTAHSSADEGESMYQNNKYSSGASTCSSNREREHGFDDATSLASNGSQKDSGLGTTTTMGIFQKMNRDDLVDTSATTPQNLNLAAHDEKISRSNSTGSATSEQDIDAIFQHYETEEYHGKFGMIKFTVQYDPNTQELLIIIGSCKGLKFGDKDTIPNPYVKTVILPISPGAAKASKKRTPTIKKCADPVFNFSIVYPGISDADIECKGIRLSVMEESSFGNNPTIGETCIPLKGLGTRPVQQFRRILDLRANDDFMFLDTKKGESNPGRIELALHYLSKQEKLVVGIIRCVGLKALDPNGYSDPYVKCYLLPDPNKKTKRKTAVKKKTLNPEFNQEFQYDITHSELAKRTLYISVWDHDVGLTNDFIGSLTLGIDSSGDILRHWFDTLKTADRRVIRWHNLSENYPIFD